MDWDEDIIKILKEVASELNMNYSEESAGKNKFCILNKDGFDWKFNYFLERDGKVKIIMFVSPELGAKPISFGSYKREDLGSKGKKEIIVRMKRMGV